jgi:hypothetical protein
MSREEIIEVFEMIIEGCAGVREDKDMHTDAKELALLIMGDCNKAMRNIRGEK